MMAEKKKKQYISDSNLEEYVRNHLREQAEGWFIDVETFSDGAILSYIQKEYEVDKEQLNRILNRLEKGGLITSKSRTINLNIPKGYEKQFRGLTDKIDSDLRFIISLALGYSLILAIIQYAGKPFTLTISTFSDLPVLFYIAILIPAVSGAVLYRWIERLLEFLYKNIIPVRETIDYFGGPKVWVHGGIMTTGMILLYVVISLWMNSEIKTEHIVSIILTMFGGTLFYEKIAVAKKTLH